MNNDIALSSAQRVSGQQGYDDVDDTNNMNANSMKQAKQENDGGDESERDTKPMVDDGSSGSMDKNDRKSSSYYVWSHIKVKELPDGMNNQTCKYCGKHKSSKQLQTTFWTKHLVDTSTKGCPTAPTEVRQTVAANSRSTDVRRLAIGEELPSRPRGTPKAELGSISGGGGGGSSSISKRAKKRLKKGQSINIVCLCGSQRSGSFNKMLMNAAMKQLEAEGANAKSIDLKELALPIYDADMEGSDFPKEAETLKRELVGADGILIVSPEYNGFTSPLLLNALTWATRGEGRMYAGFKNKVVCLMSASPGTMGGMRCIRSLQQVMQDMGAIVAPGNNSIGNAFHVFDRSGRIVDDRAQKKVAAACYQFVHLVQCHCEVLAQDDDGMEQEIAKIPNMGEYGRAEW